VGGEEAGVVEFRPGDARAVGGHRDRAVTEREMRGLSDDGTVDAAAERDRDPTHVAQNLHKPVAPVNLLVSQFVTFDLGHGSRVGVVDLP
jgi:hypothetical protein